MCGLPRLCLPFSIFSAGEVPATPELPWPRLAPLPLLTPERLLHQASTALCQRNPEQIAQLVYCHEQEPTRCFRALVQLLHNESGLRKVEVEAMLQESLSRTVTSGFVLTTQVNERIRELREEEDQRMEAQRMSQIRNAPSSRRSKVLIGPPTGHTFL